MRLSLGSSSRETKLKGRLAGFLDDDARPLGRLTVDGEDLDSLIAGEADERVLYGALQRARSVNDLRWVIAIQQRLLDLRFDPVLAVAHTRTLLRAHQTDDAAATLKRVRRPSVRSEYLDAKARLALQKCDWNQVRAVLSQPDALGERTAATLHFDFVRRLISAGATAAAFVEFAIARNDYPDEPGLAVVEVQLAAARQGWRVALDLLALRRDKIPDYETTAKWLRASLLLEQGRYRECFDFVARCLDHDPGDFALYHLAGDAARQCNSTDMLGDLLERAGTLFPRVVEIRVMRCSLAAERSEFDVAERLLPGILESSDWAYRTTLLEIACQQPGADRALAAYEACLAAGIRHGGPEIIFANYLYYYHAADGGLQRAFDLLHPLVPGRMNDSAFLRTYFRLLVGLGREQECRTAFSQLSVGMKSSAGLAPFALFFQARDAEHDKARSGWTHYMAATAHPALNAPSSYPETVRLRYEEQYGAVLAFLTIYNGIEYLDWFLDYYRQLGVAHFFITDNGSSDGTFERLLNEGDVSLFRNGGSFSDSGFGVFWTNHLLRRFGVGHWCFHLDMDEAFVFPAMEQGRKLNDLIRYLDIHGFGSVPAIMLDIYPERLGTGHDAFASSAFIDTDYFTMACEIPPYRFVQGGIRSRMSGRSLLMTKAPLIRMEADLCYLATNHQHTHLPTSDISGALLHYKFIGKALHRIDEAIHRNEHFMEARFYRSLKAPLLGSSGPGSLLSAHSIRYQGPGQLVSLNLMDSTPEWEKFLG